MTHVVSLSGGLISAVATQRVIDRYGKDGLALWFANTSWEDDDLYRFLADLEDRWGVAIERYCDGRTPLDVAEQGHIIPNNFLAPCSRILKIEPFTRFIGSLPKPITVHIGLDWWEEHRYAAPRKAYGAIDGVTVEFPMAWKPYEFRGADEIVKSWGIRIPRLYESGMPHNNCGGRCVRQGVGEWARLRIHFPERYAEVEEWEERQRAKGGKLANRAICTEIVGKVERPVTLRELRERKQDAEAQQPPLDLFGCYCTFGPADFDGVEAA